MAPAVTESDKLFRGSIPNMISRNLVCFKDMICLIWVFRDYKIIEVVN